MQSVQAAISILLLLLSTVVVDVVDAFSPPIAASPILGIGALLFRPKVKIVKSSDHVVDVDIDGSKSVYGNGGEDALTQAGKFFVDAFW